MLCWVWHRYWTIWIYGIDNMYILIPAVLGLLIKAYLLFVSRRSLHKTNFLMILCVCTLHSLCEIVTYSTFLLGKDATVLFRIYYILSVWWICYAFVYTCDVAKMKKIWTYTPIFLCCIISLLFGFTDIIISGYKSIGYSITAVKSSHYWIFQVFALSLITLSLVSLVKVIILNDDVIQKVQSIYLLLGFMAPFVTIICVIVFMQLGYKINAIAIVPIATTSFFIFLIYSEKSHGLIDIRCFLPWSPQGMYRREVRRIANLFTLQQINMAEAKRQQEKATTEYLMKAYKHKSINRIANELGVSRSTLYAILDRHDIKAMR